MMLKFTRWMGVLSLCCTVGAIACGGGDEVAEQPAQPWPGLETSEPPAIDPATPTPAPALPETPPREPAIDTLASETCNTTVAISGSADAGATVMVTGGGIGQGGRSVQADAISGRFCLPVPLDPATENTIGIRSQMPSGKMSEIKTVTIKQTDCDGATGALATAANAAVGAATSSKDEPEDFTAAMLVDGNVNSWVEFRGGGTFGWSDYNGWVAIKLDAAIEADEITVHWAEGKGSGDRYGTKYKLLVSAFESAGEPTSDNKLWSTLAEVKDGDGFEDVFDLRGNRPTVRSVALILQQDGRPHWKEGLTGLPFSSGKYDEKFRIGEIVVLPSQPAQATDTTPEVPQTCPDLN